MNKIYPRCTPRAHDFLASCGGKQDKKSSVSLSNDNDTISYALGMAQAPTPEMIKGYLMQAGSDSAYVDAFFKGMKDGIKPATTKRKWRTRWVCKPV